MFIVSNFAFFKCIDVHVYAQQRLGWKKFSLC